jgi:hypothetical protein
VQQHRAFAFLGDLCATSAFYAFRLVFAGPTIAGDLPKPFLLNILPVNPIPFNILAALFG